MFTKYLGRFAFGMLSTCGAKGFTSALLLDLYGDQYKNIANYLQISCGMTGLVGMIFLVAWLINVSESEAKVRR